MHIHCSDKLTFKSSFHARHDDFFLMTRPFGIHAKFETSNCMLLHFTIARRHITLHSRITCCITCIPWRKVKENICTVDDGSDIFVLVIFVSVVIPKKTSVHWIGQKMIERVSLSTKAKS